METCLESADGTKFEGHEVEEQRAVRLRREADEFALSFLCGRIVDVLQISRLAAKARPVIYDLAVDLP